MTRRRLIAWALIALAVSSVALLAYPYVRYRAVRHSHIRGFEDRWIGPDSPRLAMPVSASTTTDAELGELTLERVQSERCFTVRRVDNQGVVRMGVTSDDEAHIVALFGADGAFVEARRRRDPSSIDFRPLTEAEAREALGPLLKPDGMPWPWWTRLPYFAGHLRGE